ncbi:thermonuclease family protein [Waterburya agarophytonicola K14]|uniref:Thermonuclease family protein n=1 Tax=Waterburya agarophytonicola KI4 TaxID=2874699 RepID=A0A964BPU2_9CYAN|nr:thermonuclease family protein [Waterburya agarophytonicola]MCC0177069.1 thermonuclease family protein [Waterburya agarophytonicola KI4]
MCLIFLFACSPNQEKTNLYSGKVRRVLSGQTIEIAFTETYQTATVRITGIDAPDLRQSPWGKTAKERLKELVIGLPVSIETDNLKSDRFNRLNAHIWQDKTLISEKLVQEGCVLANIEYPHSYSKLLIDAQEYARLMGYGIWNPQQALRQTPNQFRSKIK